MFGKTVRPALRNLLHRFEKNSSKIRSYHEPAHMKKTTIDSIPTPCGSWNTSHRSDQSSYNVHLIVGIILFAATCALANNSGCFFLNYSVPSLKDEGEEEEGEPK